MNLLLIIISVLLSGLSQILLKIWMDKIDLSNKNYLIILWEIIKNLWIIWWLFAIFVSMILWLKVLSQNDLSFAYPFVAISFIFVFIVSYFYLWEQINIFKILGLIFIIIWIIFIYSLWNSK